MDRLLNDPKRIFLDLSPEEAEAVIDALESYAHFSTEYDLLLDRIRERLEKYVAAHFREVKNEQI